MGKFIKGDVVVTPFNAKRLNIKKKEAFEVIDRHINNFTLYVHRNIPIQLQHFAL